MCRKLSIGLSFIDARFDLVATAPHVQATQPPPDQGRSPPAVPPPGRRSTDTPIE